MYRLVAIALLTLPAAAMAQSPSRWVQLGRDIAGSAYEVDMERSQIAGNMPIVWMRVVPSALSDVRVTRLMMRAEVDCLVRRSRVLPVTDDRALGSLETAPRQNDWQEIIPGTTMERFARDICQVAERRR